MLTPQEVSSQEFAKAVFGGYDMAAVDEFLENLNKDYTDLYKENAVLKNKMKVLVDKVEEYRSTEDAMRMALLTAQKMAKEITSEAENKSKNLVQDAERTAHDKIEEYRAAVDVEAKRLAAAKEKTADFIRASNELIGRHAEFLGKLSEFVPQETVKAVKQPEKVPQEETKEQHAEAIEDSVAKIIENTMSNASGEESQNVQPDQNAAQPDDSIDETKVYPLDKKGDANTDKKRKFDFVNLQFGEDYDATK